MSRVPMQGRVFRRSLSWLGLLSTVTLSWTFVYAQDEAEATPRPSQQGPDVVLRESPERTIYEYRQNGTLTMIKIVPKKGRPYFLVPVDPTENFGELDRAASLKPQWVIREF